ncbi:MFS general substrate transporter [Mollisia scopiformis]|uniref:MFS general substrate transporter n=1 Tax=Mollisia scopiformis TaxID=149040 RepID=A0A132B5F8_MOLSC|nr:MFS general substrate transporter [Mollisia scopiformis]KUJ07648.1 MFS general substrate transporter [Mollisia scopiformis]
MGIENLPEIEAGVTTVKPSTSNEDAEPQENYLHGVKIVMLTTALMSGLFTIALDSSIISTAIPRITSDFKSLDDVAWYGAAYLLTQMSLQPSFGRVYILFPVRNTFIVAQLIFEIGSIICAIAPSSIVFIIGRAVAGISASGMYSGLMAIMRHTVETKKRPLVVSITGSVYAISGVLGPLLGGLLTDSKLTWRFCFWLNLPFGALSIAIVIWTVKIPSTSIGLTLRQKLERLDFLGALFLVSAITCLMLALQWGGILYPWSYPSVWGCLLGFGSIIILFILSQAYLKERAMIQGRIINQRTVISSSLYIIFLQLGMTTQTYFMPFYFQAVKETSAAVSGLHTLPYGITIAICSLISGTLVTKFGHYVPLVWIGTSLFTVGSALLTTLTTKSSFGAWFSFEVISGAGYGLSQQISFIAVQNVLAADDSVMGVSFVIFGQSLGGSLGLSIGQNKLSTSLSQMLKKIPGVDAAAVIRAGATKIQSVVPATLLGSVLEAYDVALTKVFVLCAVGGGMALLCSLGLEWKKVDKRT